MNENITSKDSLSIKTSGGFIEGLYIDVNMHIALKDSNGVVTDERFVHNTVTTAGKNGIVDQLLDAPSSNKLTHMAIGTGLPTGTALGSELTRVAFTSKTRLNNVLTVVSDFGAGVGTGAITEAGTFDAAAAGNMWMSANFAVINKGAGFSLTITWTLTIT